MKFRTLIASFVFTISAVFLTGQSAAYATQAHDDAAEAPYGDGWQSGDNGGSGFFPWTLNATDNAGHFIASSTGNGFGDTNGDGDIDTAGATAWGMFANSGGSAEAFRGFDQPLVRNRRFSVSMDNGFVTVDDSLRQVGMALRTGGGTNRFEFLFIAGAANTYLINDSDIGFPSNIPFTDQGLDLALTLTGPNTYDLLVTRVFDGVEYPFKNRTFGGTGEITNFRGFNDNAGMFESNNLYFNNLSITSVVPEPTSFGLLAIGMTALLLSGRRRRR